MADPNTQAPDQQVATGVPAPPALMTQPGLIDALRSQGGMPQPSMLAQSMQQTGPGPSLGLAMGSGVLNAGSGGNAANNPYLQQYQAQQNAQVEQAMKYQQLQQQQAAQQFKRDELSMTIQKDLLFGQNAIEDEKLRGPLAAQYGKSVGQMIGSPLSTGIMQSWTKGGPSMESQKNLAVLQSAADREQDPAVKQSLQKDALTYYAQHGGDPTQYEQFASKLKDPLYRKAAGLPDDAALQLEQINLKDKFRDSWIKAHPEFADIKNEHGHVVQGGVTGYADEIVRKNWGRSLFDLRDDIPADRALIEAALEGGRAKAKFDTLDRIKSEMASKQDEEKYKSDLIEQRTGRLLEQRAKLFPKAVPGAMNQKQSEEALRPIIDAENAVSDLAMLNGALQRAAKKGLVPNETGPVEAWRARAAQAWNYNDADLLAIKQTILPMIIGKIDRGLFDEKNVRFKQAFEEQMRIANSLPTVEAFQKLSDLYSYMFARNAARRVYNLETLEGQRNPGVVDLAKEQFNTLYPKGIPGDPSLLPPGSHYEYRNKQPVIVSNDGKFMKVEGQWIPKQ